MKPDPKVDAYIANFPDDVLQILEKIRAIITEIAPEAVETINYQIPTYKLNGKNLVHFAAYKKHIGFYPTPSGVLAFKQLLSDYETSKGAVKFPLHKPVPFELIAQIVHFRIDELIKK